MTAPAIIRQQREEDLGRFEEALAQLQGVTDEHIAALRQAPNSATPGARYPVEADALGQQAYLAAALRGIAEALLAQQEAAKPARARSGAAKK